MLGNLAFMRLRAAEWALSQGQLDEAYRIVTSGDLRDQKRAKAILGQLAEHYVERARDHFREDRFAEALLDLDRAEQGGGRESDIRELRANVNLVAGELKKRDHARYDKLHEAKRRIEGGSLAAGKRILEGASAAGVAVQRMKKDVEQRVEDVKQVLAQAENHLKREDFAAAADRVRKARSLDAHDPRVGQLEAKLMKQVVSRVRGAIDAGRLAAARTELAALGKLGVGHAEITELEQALSLAVSAGSAIGERRFSDAKRDAMAMQRIAPGAKWLKSLVEELGQIEEACLSLSAGPLGQMADKKNLRRAGGGAMNTPARNNHAPSGPPPAKPRSLDDTVALPSRTSTCGDLPDAFLLLVDGGGSFLVHRGDRVSIGRSAASNPADIPLNADLSERHANVARVEDDYFFFGSKDVEIGGRLVRQQLLRTGDRIVMGKKAKLRFQVPSRKSATAVLDLSETTKMPRDVRRVILLKQHATIGNGSSAHIRCMAADTPLVIYEKSDGLYIRRRGNGHNDTDPVRLEMGEPIEFAGVGLVIQPWRAANPGVRSI